MPLRPGNTKSAVHENIRREIAAGKPLKQAVAIALHTARKGDIPTKGTNGLRDRVRQRRGNLA